MNLHCFYSTITHYRSEILSLLALALAFVSYIRASRYQRSEYATRLELVDNFDLRSGVKYTAEIENKGMKPVKVKTVFIEYGSHDDPKKRIRGIVKGPFFLSPGDRQEIGFDRPQTWVESKMQELQILECFFILRVVYHTATGNIVEVTRKLGGYDEEGTKTVVVHIGRALT